MRWGVPVAAIAVVGAAIGAGPVIAAVQGEPSLPDRTAEQLLAEAARTVRDQAPPAMSGTVVETASLGLPALPLPQGASSSPLSLLSGSHTVKVWYGGDGRFRLALPGQMSETDVIADGKGSAWLWESATNTATQLTVPGDAAARPLHTPAPTAVTPRDFAAQALKAAEQTTAVRVENGEHVAGRAAYQVVLAPKDPASLVDKVTLALDGETYVPLRVRVFAKGAAEPAFEVGFTQVSFSAPAPENFAFTPPAGATVKRQTFDGTGGPGDHAEDAAGAAARRFLGSGWGTIAELPFSPDDLSANGKGGDGRAKGGDPSQLLESVLKSATPVSGPWGSGKVVKTKLLSVLLTDDGRLLAGAVTPEALVKAAGRG
ncbi:membrane protein [Sphaerisporangium krabiense]|uniref:Outer membrane lipoprotein-sorting protein n=1 Tax=Sphaerisporangium krabiense TaxID=763782 RepID=A0A7W9DSQ0_9ACTN|nr:DUF2092 domain-containing protein [Sphaerisporangium krabiense]MBB5629811.1 outer membrane lipoprotein-sorting protein [Sphaerisporangium krabiense]GII63910.1 membrane protein [Sphaerisporangium krabiense]